MKKIFYICILISGVFFYTACDGQKSNSKTISNPDTIGVDTVSKLTKSKIKQGVSISISNGDSVKETQKDTLNLEDALREIELFVNDCKKIHITKASDTLKYEHLREKWANNDKYAYPKINEDKMKHSDKVRWLKAYVSLFSEMKRMYKEYKNAGLNGFNEEELSLLQKILEQYQRKLWLETH